MPDSNRPGRTEALILAVGFGVWADTLLVEPPGLGLALVGVLFVSGAALLGRLRGTWPAPTFLYLALAGVFAALTAWRASPVLILLALLGSAVSLGLTLWAAQGERLRRTGLADLVRSWFFAAGATVLGPRALAPAGGWGEMTVAGRFKRSLAVGRGVLLGLPLVAAFGAILAAADPIFGDLYGGLLGVNLTAIGERLLPITIWAWLAAGLLGRLLAGPDLPRSPPIRMGQGSIGPTEVGIALAGVNLVFLLFIVVQLRTLFGGDAFVEAATGLTYAEYARSGFFHLAAAAALVLPLQLGADWVRRRSPEAPGVDRSFRALALLMLVLLAGILASAFWRMRLYTAAYGLTEQRLYVSVAMVWLAGVMAWFALTVIPGRRERFAGGALALGLAAILALQVLNPDAVIARTNLARAEAGRPLDAAYLAMLSDDAVPLMVDAFPRLAGQDRCRMAGRLVGTGRGSSDDWRAWNLSRVRAGAAVGAARPALELAWLACQRGRGGSGGG